VNPTIIAPIRQVDAIVPMWLAANFDGCPHGILRRLEKKQR
jgi:hypothetical protein